MTKRLALACLLVAGWTNLAHSDEPAPKTEPMPRDDGPATIITISRPPIYFGTRRIWEYYGVDSAGRFRPLVVRSPFSTSYYLHNGLEYPWTTTRTLNHMPYATD